MGFKPIPYKKWCAWLKSRGLVQLRTKGSHEVWDNPTSPYIRPVVFRQTKKDIPGMHIQTCLNTMGVTYQEFEKELKGL